MSTSLLNLYRLIAKELGYSSGTCSSAGTTTTIVDVSTDSPLEAEDTASLFQNSWAMIESDTAGTPLNVAEVRRIKTYAPSTGTLTTSRAFTNNTTTTQSYGIYFGNPPTRHGLTKGIDEYIDEVLRHLYYGFDVLITQITDGDMETSGVSNYAASSSAATKSTTTGVILNDQALTQTNSGANGYIGLASANRILVSQGETYEIAVDVTPSSVGTASLQAYDITNSAVIYTTNTYNGQQSRRLWQTATVPSTCEVMDVRLIGAGATDIIYWDNLTVRKTNLEWLALPSWFVNPKWVDYMWYWPAGNQLNNAYAIDERQRPRLPDAAWRVVDDHTGNAAYRIEWDIRPPSGAHLFAHCVRPYGELTHSSSGLTTTTDANQDWVKAWVLTRIYEDRKDEANTKRWLAEARDLHRRHNPKIAPKIKLDRWF